MANLASTTTPTNDSVEDNSFTVVTYRKQSGVTRTSHVSSISNAVVHGMEKDMLYATTTKFANFHKDTLPIVNVIIQDTANTTHASVQLWNNAQASGQMIQDNTTFCLIAKLLHLKDLHGYRNFLESLPWIGDYLQMADDEGKMGFLYKIKLRDHLQPTTPVTPPSTAGSVGRNTTKDDHSVGSNNSITTNRSSKTLTQSDDNWIACYGTSTDLNEMLTAFWPRILQFMRENSSHHHSLQWQQWIDIDKLKPDTELTQVKAILGVTTMDQLYIVLRDSPAINTHYEVLWDHKICCQPRPLATQDISVPSVAEHEQQPDANLHYWHVHEWMIGTKSSVYSINNYIKSLTSGLIPRKQHALQSGYRGRNGILLACKPLHP